MTGSVEELSALGSGGNEAPILRLTSQHLILQSHLSSQKILLLWAWMLAKTDRNIHLFSGTQSPSSLPAHCPCVLCDVCVCGVCGEF